MIALALKYLTVFPAWIQQTVLVLCGLVFIAALTALLIKILLTPPIQICFRSLGSLSVRFGIYLTKQMDDPSRRSGENRVILYLDVVLAYLMSGLLVSIAVSFTTLWALRHGSLSAMNTSVLLGYIILCWVVAAVLKAQGGRQRMKLRVSAKM